VRQDGKIYALSIDSNSRIENAPPELADMCRIVSQVHGQHSYLLSAVEE
jgi:putative selenate reductase